MNVKLIDASRMQRAGNMVQTDYETAIIEQLLKISRRSTEVNSETNIARDLGLDSLAVMDLVMALEDHFDLSIPLDRIAETETVRQLAALVESLQEEVPA